MIVPVALLVGLVAATMGIAALFYAMVAVMAAATAVGANANMQHKKVDKKLQAVMSHPQRVLEQEIAGDPAKSFGGTNPGFGESEGEDIDGGPRPGGDLKDQGEKLTSTPPGDSTFR